MTKRIQRVKNLRPSYVSFSCPFCVLCVLERNTKTVGAVAKKTVQIPLKMHRLYIEVINRGIGRSVSEIRFPNYVSGLHEG